MRDRGAPSTDPGARSDRGEDNGPLTMGDHGGIHVMISGDLDSPHVKEYPGCKSNSWECRGVKDD